jgi:high frequency lysogenization protein
MHAWEEELSFKHGFKRGKPLQDKFEDITIALAGIMQAISLTREIAQTGKMDEKAFETMLNSIFQTHPGSTMDIYGSLENLKLGLIRLISILNSKATAAAQSIHYMHSVMRLQKKINSSPKISATLLQRLNQTKKQVAYFSLTHPTVIASLADIYLNTIKTFRFKFFIVGNQRMLTVNENIEKIRALLLAAIRSSVLWRQVGGSRLQLIFFRGKIKNTAEKLLSQIEGK